MDWRLSIRLKIFNKFFSVDHLQKYKPHENFVSICPCDQKKKKMKSNNLTPKDEEAKSTNFGWLEVLEISLLKKHAQNVLHN